MPATCPICQKELPENYGAVYCPFCGKDLPPPVFALVETREPSVESPPAKVNLPLFFGALFAPALLTLLVALFKSETATSIWILASSPVAAIVAAVVLSGYNAGKPVERTLAILVYVVAFSIFCLMTSFFGCALAGGGGVKIGG
jgi:hypothetical protein